MSNKYEIKFSPLFYSDLEEIINYIKYKLKNRVAAEQLVEKILNEIEKRKYYPKAYKSYVSIKERKDTYYKIYVNNYVIFYVVKENVIEMRRILYSKRSFENIL